MLKSFFSFSFGKMLLLPETRSKSLSFFHPRSGGHSLDRHRGMTSAAMLPFYHLGPLVRISYQEAGIVSKMLKCGLRSAFLYHAHTTRAAFRAFPLHTA